MGIRNIGALKPWDTPSEEAVETPETVDPETPESEGTISELILTKI